MCSDSLEYKLKSVKIPLTSVDFSVNLSMKIGKISTNFSGYINGALEYPLASIDMPPVLVDITMSDWYNH